MSYQAVPGFLLPDRQPADIPDLAAFWRFDETASEFTACQGQPYTLRAQAGEMTVEPVEAAPLGGYALRLDEGQWLACPRADCPLLDVHGPDGQLTVITWIRRGQKSNGECEFIAGQWNETHRSRQYGLFLNIGVWQTRDQICGHLSHVGGPTPGYRYCIDGPMGETPIPRQSWSVVAMTYDGHQGRAYLNGVLDARPGLNPYHLAGGLNDGGPDGSDFTVGAVNRHGETGNFFVGHMAGLAVYRRALTPAEIQALATMP